MDLASNGNVGSSREDRQADNESATGETPAKLEASYGHT